MKTPVIVHDVRLCFPTQPQCSTDPYVGGNRCRSKATVFLFAPDGTPNPGGYMCSEHGEAVVVEFRDKLHETWTLKPIHIYNPGQCVPKEINAR